MTSHSNGPFDRNDRRWAFTLTQSFLAEFGIYSYLNSRYSDDHVAYIEARLESLFEDCVSKAEDDLIATDSTGKVQIQVELIRLRIEKAHHEATVQSMLTTYDELLTKIDDLESFLK